MTKKKFIIFQSFKRDKHTTCLMFSFSEMFITDAMFDRLNGCWPSLSLKENIVEVRPLPYENMTIRWPPCRFENEIRSKVYHSKTKARYMTLRNSPEFCACYEEQMQMPHREMRCTCSQLPLGPKWTVELLRRIIALQLAEKSV